MVLVPSLAKSNSPSPPLRKRTHHTRKHRQQQALRIVGIVAIALFVALFVNIKRIVVRVRVKPDDPITLAWKKLEQRLEKNVDHLFRSSYENEDALVPTVDCEALLRNKQTNALGFADTNSGVEDQYETLVQVKGVEPTSFWVSVHSSKGDASSTALKSQNGHGERALGEIWRNILEHAPAGSFVLDVGSGLGYWGLVTIAQSGGFRVHVFEANPVHNLRTCESLVVNEWNNQNNNLRRVPGSSITSQRLRQGTFEIHSVAVSDHDQEVPYRLAPNHNPFEADFDPEQPSDLLGKTHVMKKMVTLDTFATSQGWLPNNATSINPRNSRPTIKILRIDGNANLQRVLLGSWKLLKKHHLVDNIFLQISAKQGKADMQGWLASANEARLSMSFLMEEAGYQIVGFGSSDEGPTSTKRDEVLRSKANVQSILDLTWLTPTKAMSIWFQYPDPIGKNLAWQLLQTEQQQEQPQQVLQKRGVPIRLLQKLTPWKPPRRR